MKANTLSVYIAYTLTLTLVGCERGGRPDTTAGVSWALAEHRAATLSDVRYEVKLQIPDSLSERIRGLETIRFSLSDAGEPVVIDFHETPESVISVASGDTTIVFDLVNDHIVIPQSALRAGANAIEIEFWAGDNSLNRNRDYLYTLFVPDRARFAIPCFDQPNLKARYSLSLDVPADWHAVANGPLESFETEGERALFSFAETEPISTYLFSFAAGEFEVVSGERDGREMRMYHRETDSTKVLRNVETVFDLHATALAWLEEYTGIPYPFEKFDFVAIPSFQYGGMEHPGAILYRASSLFLDEAATQNAKLGRASLISHETAHMWFGDLVTMDWFNDVWMKEVFANFMAAKIVNPSFPDIDHDLRFVLAHYPTAYSVDRTAGANPIRQDLDNLKNAGTLYGAIIYQKAPIVMKQLEVLMGVEPLRDGLREYLRTYSFGNANWPDLIDILDARVEDDLASWSHVWVEQPRRPKISVSRELDEGRNVASLVLSQQDPEDERRTWRQAFNVLMSYPHKSQLLITQMDSQSVEVAGAKYLPAPEYTIPNGLGVAYGLFELDESSLDYLMKNAPSIPDALTRGIVWLTLWDAMLEAWVPAAEIVDLAAVAIATEKDELLVQRLLSYLQEGYWRFLSGDQRADRTPDIESLLWALLEGAPTPSLKASYFQAFRSIAMTDTAVSRLGEIWREELVIDGLPLSERDFSRIAQELALREVADWEGILNEQEGRITNPDRQERFSFVSSALSADPDVRDRFFEGLRDPANREHEPWVLEAVGFLHHPLRATSSEKYIRPSLDLLEEIQATGDIFFPKRWLDSTLGGHNSEAAAAIVRGFLNEHVDYPPRLRGKILQSADGLFRASRPNP